MKSNSHDWDQVRAAFACSIMVDTPLSSLAQNLDGPDWPIKRADETPSAYIDLEFGDAQQRLTEHGQPSERMDELVAILCETLAFDHPFAEMLQQTASAEARDNEMLRNLARLGIPENFPMALTALDADMREFCRRELLNTLGQFALFAQRMSQTVIVGGDFRRMLNALSSVDEATLAKLLPFRRGATGLHLAEALAQAMMSPEPAVHATAAVAWFKDEAAGIRADLERGGDLAKHFKVLADAKLEAGAAQLMKRHCKEQVAPQRERGAWRAFLRLFQRRAA